MMTLFRVLPDEVNLQILENCDYSSLMKIYPVEELTHLLDWNFWRNKAEKELSIPGWYFDLPLIQERQINPNDRFLEISSKFWISSESVLRFEDEEIKGIYEECTAKKMAIQQGNFEAVACLGGTDDEIDYAKDLSRKKACGISDSMYWDVLVKSGISFEEFENIFRLAKRKDLEQIEQMIESQDNLAILIGVLAFSFDEQFFPLVDERFPLLNPDQQFLVLNYVLGCGDLEHFEKLARFENLLDISNISHDQLISLLKRAYFVAEPECVKLLHQKIFYSCDSFLLVSSLIEGYLFNPRPVEVYQIFCDIYPVLSEQYSFEIMNETSDIDLAIFSFSHKPEEMVDKIRYEVGSVGTPIPLRRYCLSWLKKMGKFDILRETFLIDDFEFKAQLFKEISYPQCCAASLTDID